MGSESLYEVSEAVAGVELSLPSGDETLLPEVYVGVEIDLFAPGDGVVTDRHHASASNYEAGDPMNQIGGQISPFTLSGWLRHGCERVVQVAGGSVCHPGEASADYMLEDVYERDLAAGYHEKGSCVDDAVHSDRGCVVFALFGGFDGRPGELLRRPVGFSPVRSQVDVLRGEAEAHYRQLYTQVRSRNEVDGGQPLRVTGQDVLGNVEGTWWLTLRSVRPSFVGLLVEAVDYLDAHSDEYAFQVGGARNFGAGIADVFVVNPLYSEAEVKRVFNRAKGTTAAMEAKDERWRSEVRPEFVRALQHRIRDADALADPVETEGSG